MLLNWTSVISAGLLQLISKLTQGSKVMFAFQLLEPVVFVVALYLIRSFFKQNVPNYGTSLFLFYASGILPCYLFIRVSARARIVSVGPNTLLPSASGLDAQVATALLYTIFTLSTMLFVFLGMWLWGIREAEPQYIPDCIAPISLLILFGFGVGVVNNVIGRYLLFWHALYSTMTRGLIFLSGAVFVVDLTPIWVRKILIINPLSHAVEWFRLGLYGRYPHNSLDKDYLLGCALIFLLLGLVLDRVALRYSKP